MKRRHIPLKTKLAAALACLLPQTDRDWHRKRNSHADEILKLFDWDHVSLHCFGGSDLWWNLDPKSKAEHREKSRRDTSIVAKVKRLSARGQEAVMIAECFNCLGYVTPSHSKKGKRQWPSRKLGSKPFPKGRRPARATQT